MTNGKTKRSAKLYREMHSCQFPVWASKFNCNTCNQDKKTEQLFTEKSNKEEIKSEETGVIFQVAISGSLVFWETVSLTDLCGRDWGYSVGNK